METKEQILKDIQEAQEKLDNAKKKLEELENCTSKERWKPCIGESFYYIDLYLEIRSTIYYGQYIDYLYDTDNIFKTSEEANERLEYMKTRTQIKDIALRLNNGKKIDWENIDEPKYYIYYNVYDKAIRYDKMYSYKRDTIYCLNICFIDVALKEIGFDRLKKYFMYGE